ncbi:MAG: hypothetical protein RLZZ543_980 [Bacteroidota bacterium]
MAVQRILIIRFSSIGDIVLTTPLVRCLAKQFPNAELHYLTKPSFKNILDPNPYLHKVWLWEDQPKEVLRQLKEQRFDVVIDLHHNLRSKRVKLALGRPSVSFNKLNVEKYLYVNFRINRLPNVHIVDRYLATVAHLGVKNDAQGLDYFIRPEDEFDLTQLPQTHQNGYVAVVTGALKNTKRMPEVELSEVCKRIGLPIVLLGGKAEAEFGAHISKDLGEAAYNTCGEISLGQSASLVKQASVVLTHDTGLMHIAAAFHKPIVSIWGNTVPEFGMYPYLPQASDQQFIAQVEGLSCRPCSKIGHAHCPKKHFRCMKDQNLVKIAEEVKRMFVRPVIA